MPAASAITASVRKQDLGALERALAKREGPIPAQAIVGAGQAAWKAGLVLLKRHGADLDASYKNYRALHALIQERPHAGGQPTPARVACLKWLLAHGADPELAAAWPAARALIVAALVGERVYVEALLAGGARKDDVFAAAALGDARTVARVLARDPSLARARDGGLLTALQCAAGSRLGAADPKTAKGLLECARRLVAAGADVNVLTRTWSHDVGASYFAIRAGQVEMLEHLLDHGLDATAAIPTAAWERREDILDLLLRRGGRIDAALDHTRPVLNELVRWGQFTQARMLLARGADPNRADADRGWTAVHQAASRGNLKMMETLLAAGGDVTRRDAAGRTPADIARVKDLVRLLRAAVSGARRADSLRVRGSASD